MAKELNYENILFHFDHNSYYFVYFTHNYKSKNKTYKKTKRNQF